MEDLLEADVASRSRSEKMRLGTMILTAIIGLICTAILTFSWRAWDNIATLAAESALARSERLAIQAQGRNDKELIMQQLAQLASALAENKIQNSAAISELRLANSQMQKDVTALGVKVDMISQQQRENGSRGKP